MVPLSFIEISDRLRKTELPETDLVVGIGSGGVVAAALVAFHLRTELHTITLNYRDENNTPRYEAPIVLQSLFPDTIAGKRVLLVDDVSVTGKTLEAARKLLQGATVTTLTLKGKADIVLFPDVQDCVMWPWK